MNKIDNFRYVKKGHGIWSLSDHEIKELDIDFDIQTNGYHVIASLTKGEWEVIKNVRSLVNRNDVLVNVRKA